VVPSPTVSWTDIGTFAVLAAQLLVLVIGGYFAWRQVREARRLREETVRPFVLLDFEPFNAFVELSIKNVGSLLARNVRFTFDPPVETTFDSNPEFGPLAEKQLFQEGIPSLPPAKEIRMMFDRGVDRTERGLPDSYEVEVSYTDPFGHPFTERMVIDFGIYRSRGPIHRKGLHEIHALLEKRLPEEETQ